MRRLSFFLWIGCSVLWALCAQAQTTSSPEPSQVYGYISLVDSKGTLHLTGYPTGRVDSLTAFFRPVTGVGTRAVVFLLDKEMPILGEARLPEQRQAPPVALWYNIYLYQNRTKSSQYNRPGYNGEPIKVDIPLSLWGVEYNPDQWRFDHVEVSPYRQIYVDESGAEKEVLRRPLAPRKTPFAQFPNITQH